MEKKRVVAYARVSTDKDDQKNSLESQKSYFTRELDRFTDCRLIKSNISGLCENGVYYDEGVSGTKIKRPGLDRLLQDAGLQAIVDIDNEQATTKYKVVKKSKFDLIYVKDTTRFARNVSIDDVLKTLASNNVYVYFLDINKTSQSNEDMTYIQIFLSFAERESRDRSVKVKFGYRERMRQGQIYMGGNILGYDYDAELNSLFANKDAELVRLVFNLYTEEELGQQVICNTLAEKGYFNTKGNKYTRSTIKRMLCNEKYIGETTSGRYCSDGDVFSKRPNVPNDYDYDIREQARKAQQELLEQQKDLPIRQREHYIEPIISREQFEKAQAITERNRKKYNNDCTYHGITDYARKIVCCKCGAFYTASGRKEYKGKGVLARYSCRHKYTFDADNGIPKCDNPTVREDYLDSLLDSETYYMQKLQALEGLLTMSETAKEELAFAIDEDKTLEVQRLQEEIESLKEQNKRLVKLFALGTIDETLITEQTKENTEKIQADENKIIDLSTSNNELRTQIQVIDELVKDAKKDIKQIRKYVETKDYPVLERKIALRDVEKIEIDSTGKGHVIFRSTQEMSKAQEILLLRMQELDREELARLQAEYEKEQQGKETTHRTIEEIMEDFNAKGKGTLTFGIPHK